MNEIIIFQTSQKCRLDELLRKELPKKINVEFGEQISNSKIRRLIVSGAVEINNRKINIPAFEIRGESKIKIEFDKEKFFYEKQVDDIHFEVSEQDVLFENDDLIFINKPAFFPVEQTITKNRDNLHDAVVRFLWNRNKDLRNRPYVGIMHRLDRETSGVILFTKNRDANKKIHEMFENHLFEKKYIAICEVRKKLKIGTRFTVEILMNRITGKSKQGKWGKVPELKGGLYSKTEFKIIDKINIENKNCYKIECNLFTGRTHQIRVHLSEFGLPILGDELYGGAKAKRIYLHSSLLKSENFEVHSELFVK